MRLFPVLLCAACAMICAADKQKAYTTKYDNVDVESILSNNRILTSYIKCMLEEGPCTPDGRELKSEYYLLSELYPRVAVIVIMPVDICGFVSSHSCGSIVKLQPETYTASFNSAFNGVYRNLWGSS
jgi:hypothetical protein